MFQSASLDAAIAAHRFGLGEASLGVVTGSPRDWLLGQIGPADAACGEGLLSTREALEYIVAERAQRRSAKNPPPGASAAQSKAVAAALGKGYREISVADTRSRLLTALTTARPFAERLQWFWANHFTVSLAKGSARGLVGAFERDAIRPHIAGSFEALLVASTTHPAMLRYLDNVQSAGPSSRAVVRAATRAANSGETARVSGLNENLAREVLELHTLGAESARGTKDSNTQGRSTQGSHTNASYTQADVTAFASVLTGWRVGLQDTDPTRNFDAAWHEPGRKTVLGKTYPEGPEALLAVLHDLAAHPATATFIATKLARHFVADEPPRALVDRLARTYLRSNGELAPVYRELIASDEAWSSRAVKLKTPEEFIVSSARLLGLNRRSGTFAQGSATRLTNPPGADQPANVMNAANSPAATAPTNTTAAIGAAAIAGLGQRLQTAPSPAGWSDRADDWLGPDAVWKRVEWSTRTAGRLGADLDARALAADSLGPLLSDSTRTQIDRAAGGTQALVLLLMAPEFQRR